MTKYIKCGGGGLPPQVLSDMEAVLNKKFGTSTTYPSNTWPDLIRTMIPLPEKMASGSIAHFEDGADTVPLKSSKFYITPQQAAGTPTPSTPLPISGHTGLTITRTGANLFNKDGLTWNKWYNSDGTLVANARYGVMCTPFKCDSSKDIFVNCTNKPNSFAVVFFDVNNTFISRTFNNQSTRSQVTPPANAVWCLAQISCVTSTDITQAYVDNAGVMVSQGSEISDFTPYTATTYPVTLGQTVYGGFVKDGEVWGTLHKVTPNEDFTFVIDSQTSSICTIYFAFAINNLPTGKNGGVCVSNMFSKTIPSGTAGRMVLTGNQIYMVLPKSDGSTWTTTEVKQWFEDNPTDICYELATPVLVADLEEVEINSLLGVNNIWCECGDSEVEYRADIELSLNE